MLWHEESVLRQKPEKIPGLFGLFYTSFSSAPPPSRTKTKITVSFSLEELAGDKRSAHILCPSGEVTNVDFK